MLKIELLIILILTIILISPISLSYSMDPPDETVHQHITNESKLIWKLLPSEIKIHILNPIIASLDFPIVAGYESGDDIVTGSGEEDLVASTWFAGFGNHFWQPDSPQIGFYNDGLDINSKDMGSSYVKAKE